MKAPIKTKNDVAFGKPEMIEKINMNSNKDIKSPEKEEKTQNLNDLKGLSYQVFKIKYFFYIRSEKTPRIKSTAK